MVRLLSRPLTIVALGVLAFGLVASCGDDDPGIATTASSAAPAASSSSSSSSAGGSGGEGGAPDVGGGGAGGGVIPDTGADTCPGDPYTLNVGDVLNLGGDTSQFEADYIESTCGATSSTGRDAVYDVTFNGVGTFKVSARTATGSTLDPTLYPRLPEEIKGGGCETVAPGCLDFHPTIEGQALEIDSSMIPSLYIFVDGADESEGEYVLRLEFQAPACGDDAVNTGEECDDGNTLDDDGCDSACALEDPSLFDECDGEQIPIALGEDEVRTAGTTGYVDNYDATTCAGGVGVGGPDYVFEIAPSTNGNLVAKIGYETDGTTSICGTAGLIDPGCWDYVLWAYGPDTCVDPGGAAEIECVDDQAEAYVPEQISFPVTGGDTYYIVVDGYDEFQFGPFNLHVELN
jgi:cysteine-rich repeat protein